MKKALLIAFAALCAFAAQAVTVKWSGTNMTATKGETLESNKSFAIALVNTVSDNNERIWLQVINQDNNSNNPKYNVSTLNGEAKFYLNGDTSKTAIGDTTSVTLGEKSVLVVNLTANGNKNYTVEFYCNGDKLTSYDVTFAGAPRFWVNTTSEAVIYEGTLTEEKINYLVTNQTATVPEPTALALLALGVAGLALRRKA